MLNAGLERSRSDLVFEIRNNCIFGMLYCFEKGGLNTCLCLLPSFTPWVVNIWKSRLVRPKIRIMAGSHGQFSS